MALGEDALDGCHQPVSKKTGMQARFLAGVILSAAALMLALRDLDWAELGAALGRVRLGWLLAAVVVEMVVVWVNAARWRWLFWPHFRPRVRRLFGTLCVAQLANAVLPGRMGLLIRALLVGKGGQISRATALTTLAVEKALEGVTLLLLGVGIVLALDVPDWLRASVIASGGIVLVLLVVLGGGLRWRESLVARISRRTAGWLPGAVRALFDGLDSLRSAKAGWRLWALSLVYWALVTLVNWLAIRAMDLSVPAIASLVLLVVLQMGVRIPSSPGSIGVFDYLGVISLAIFGVEKEPALAVTLLLHLIFYLPSSLVGVCYLLWMSTGLGRLRRAALAAQE